MKPTTKKPSTEREIYGQVSGDGSTDPWCEMKKGGGRGLAQILMYDTKQKRRRTIAIRWTECKKREEKTMEHEAQAA